MREPDVRSDYPEEFARALEREPRLSEVRVDTENVERGLVQLVLTLVELLRQLLERQAIRRMEGGSLTPEEIDRLGRTLYRLERKMEELKRHFNIDDLNLDLGPLGRLLD